MVFFYKNLYNWLQNILIRKQIGGNFWYRRFKEMLKNHLDLKANHKNILLHMIQGDVEK
jgi:hypothetical protein